MTNINKAIEEIVAICEDTERVNLGDCSKETMVQIEAMMYTLRIITNTAKQALSLLKSENKEEGVSDERTAQQCLELVEQTLPHIVGRFLDPKNEAHGSHLTIPALKMYRWIQHEALEASQAYRNKEGFQREIEECSDGILLSIMRIDQLIKENS